MRKKIIITLVGILFIIGIVSCENITDTHTGGTSVVVDPALTNNELKDLFNKDEQERLSALEVKSVEANNRLITTEEISTNHQIPSPLSKKLKPCKVGSPLSNRAKPKSLTSLGYIAQDEAGMRAETAEAKGAIEEMTIQPFDADALWVIAKPEGNVYDTDGMPTEGTMRTKRPGDDTQYIPLPLKHTDVKGHISAYIASVDVIQKFHNPYDTKIEVEYVFPLPQNAAVNDFVMTIGDRKIRGIIRERKEAEQIYRAARKQGYAASLLNQERPNIFTQKVANIEPLKEIDIHIHYFNTLTYHKGWYEFVFPMVVGPRYNPAGSTDGIGAVTSGKTSSQPVTVSYLKPNERSGHDIAISLDIDAGVTIEDIACRSHVIEQDVHDNRANITLSALDSIPNKDFVFRYKVAGKNIKTSVITHHDKKGDYFTMMLYPPAEMRHLKRTAMEMIFVLDCSGSMQGEPMRQAKEAIVRGLKQLDKNDTFQVIRFSNSASTFGDQPVAATPENIREAIAYVEKLHGSGGTQMIEGVKAALNFPHDKNRLRLVSFMTDGYIGNEKTILAAIDDHLGAARIFSFGVGSSPNRYLMDRMAWFGKGAVAYFGKNDSPTKVMDQFYETIAHPGITDIKLDFGALAVTDLFGQCNDLFIDRPVIIVGKITDGHTDTITISGRANNQPCEYMVPICFNKDKTHPGVAAIWARKKIESLANGAIKGNDAIEATQEITMLALHHGLMSKFTSFIAVDSSRVTAGDHGVTINVAVPVPDGVKYETAVGLGVPKS